MTTAPRAVGRRPLDAADLVLAVILGLVALAAYTLLFQERFYGDASFLFFSYRRGEANYHVVHWLVTRGFTALGLDLAGALRLATLVPAMIAPPMLFLAVRRTGASLMSSTFCTVLAGASSSAYFFSTTIEVHAVQMAGVNLGFLALALLPGRSLLSSVALGVTGAVLLAGSHTTAILVLPAVLLYFWFAQREAGTPRAVLLRWFGVVGAVAAVGFVLVVRRYMEVQKVTLPELVDWALWDLTPVREDSWVPAPLVYLETEMVRPLYLYLPLASLGILLDLFRDRARASVTLLWIGVPAFVLAGMPFGERGAYFLTLVPVLAWTLAHGIDALAGLFGGRGLWIAAPLMAGALFVQGAAAEIVQNRWDKPLSEEGRAWVDAFLEVSDGRGVYLTANGNHFEWTDGWTTMPAEDSRKAIGLPAEEVARLTAMYANWARRAADTGDPLYVDAEIAQAAKLDPKFAESFAEITELFELEPVESGPFRALRGR